MSTKPVTFDEFKNQMNMLFDFLKQPRSLNEIKSFDSNFIIYGEILLDKKIILKKADFKDCNFFYEIDKDFVIFTQDYIDIYNFFTNSRTTYLEQILEPLGNEKIEILQLELSKTKKKYEEQLSILKENQTKYVSDMSKYINEKIEENKILKQLLDREPRKEIYKLFGIPFLTKTILEKSK